MVMIKTNMPYNEKKFDLSMMKPGFALCTFNLDLPIMLNGCNFIFHTLFKSRKCEVGEESINWIIAVIH